MCKNSFYIELLHFILFHIFVENSKEIIAVKRTLVQSFIFSVVCKSSSKFVKCACQLSKNLVRVSKI